jgi:hypothetical protein
VWTCIVTSCTVTTCTLCYILYCVLYLVLSVTYCTVCYILYSLLHLVLSVTSCTLCYILYCLLLLVLSVTSCTLCYILYCLLHLVLSVTHRRLKMMVCIFNVTNVNVITFRFAVSGHIPGLLKRGKVSTYYCVTDDLLSVFDFWNTLGESGVSHLPCCKFLRCYRG